MLIVVSGLPGVGKTTIAGELARSLGAVCVRIDSIEQALRNAGAIVEGEGYAVALAVAGDNLRIGQTVVADCVNPWPLTRDEWRAVGERIGVAVVEVEVVCSDQAEHRRRVESRVADIPGHRVPAWQDVVERDYRAWDRQPLIIDTARRSVSESVQAIVARCRKVLEFVLAPSVCRSCRLDAPVAEIVQCTEPLSRSAKAAPRAVSRSLALSRCALARKRTSPARGATPAKLR